MPSDPTTQPPPHREHLLEALDAIGKSVCLLDEHGRVVWTNTPWRQFAGANHGDMARCGIGADYLAQCRTADPADNPEAHEFADRLQEVLRGERREFVLDYECHGPDQQRWFRARVHGWHHADRRGAVVTHEETSAQWHLQHALVAGQARYRNLFDAAPDAAFLIAADGEERGRILDANDAAGAMHGYTHAELLAMRIGDLDVPADAATVSDRLQQLLTHGQVRFEVRHRRKDRSEFPVEVSARLALVGGRPCAISFNRDISERATAQTELREQQLRLELAAKAGGIGFWDWNMLSDEVFYSPEWKAQLGHGDDEIRSHYSEWERRVHPEDLPRVLHDLQEHFAGRTQTHVAEFRLRHKDGSHRWILARGQVLRDADGRPRRMVGCHVDVTDHREAVARAHDAAARMRTIYETEPQCIKTVTPDGRLIDMNPAGLRMIETDRMAAVAGLRVLELVHVDDRAAYRDLHDRVAAGGTGSLQFRIVGLHGTPRWMETHSVPLRDRTGTIESVLSVTHDISDRKRAEAEREALARQMQQVQKLEAIGTLSGGIAHDFNNILTVISGNLELAQLEAAAGSPQHDHLREARQAAERARALVRQILTFSHNQPVDRQPVLLGPIVNDAVRFLRATIPHTVAIELRLHDVPPVLADAAQIHRVLVNLGTNAWHAMDDRPGRLAVELLADRVDARRTGEPERLPPGSYALLRVGDDGHGMDQAVLRRIFEPFFTTKAPGKGTGLGLSVVHGIVHAHGGHIAVDSTVGAGTTFRIWLPLDTTAPPRDAGAPAPRHGGGRRVLLVDDEPALVRVLANSLERFGYRVTAYTDPEPALAAFLAAPDAFDVVVTDFDMPRMPGLQLATQVTARRPDVPVLLCSGFLKPETLAATAAAGIRRVLNKPFTGNELATALGELHAGRDGG
jgi:PAS domain S-box-containing protein